MKLELPSQEYLRMLLRYDPQTGVLLWRKRSVALFGSNGHTAEHTCNKWNSRMAGKPALAAIKGDGYAHGAIDGVHYSSHRVIWKWMTGDDPDEIDHINGVRDDNRWANLRSVSRALNGKNCARHKDNLSGVTGVRYQKRDKLWQAYMIPDGVFIHLGAFKKLEAAIAARKAGEKRQGFHRNHGRTNPAA